MRLVLAASTLFLLLAVLSGFGFGQGPAGGQELAKKRCLSCHDQTRICRALGVRSLRAWFQTEGRMVHHGAMLNPGEMDVLARWLAIQDMRETPLCN